MLLFILKRLVSAAILMVVVSVGSFFLIRLAQPDPVASLFGKVGFTQEEYDLKKTALGLDKPLLEQFWTWFSHMLTGDFGNTWVGAPTPIAKDLAVRLPITLSVVIFGIILMAIIGAILGILAGIRPGGVFDRSMSWVSVILFAIPGFLIAIFLVYLFGIQLHWLPVAGYVKPERNFFGWIGSITLPAFSVALGGIVMIAQQLRNAIVTANGSDYVRTLRARGLRAGSISIHLLRNSAPAALTILALMFVSLLSGTVIIESVFNFPGLGQATKDASQQGNMPMILALTVITVLFVAIVNFALDLVLGWINPKARIK